MSSLVTQAFVFERYGARLSTADLAEIMKIGTGTIRNQLSAGTFPIKTYVDGGQRWAAYQDVADHLDSLHAQAA